MNTQTPARNAVPESALPVPSSERRVTWATGVLILIILAGAFLRAHEFGTVHSWFDESLGWRMSQFSPSEIVARSERNVHPPFHFLLLSGWRALFGGSLLALRTYSVFWGLGTIVGGYLVARTALTRPGMDEAARSRSEFAGLVAATLIACSALHISWSQQIKMYELGTCLTLWSTWCLLSWFQEERFRWLVAYVPLAAGLALQHHYGTFTVFAQLTFALMWSARRAFSGGWSKHFLPVLLASWATTSLWTLWLPSFLIQRNLVKDSYWIGKFQWSHVVNVWNELFLTETAIPRSELLTWGIAELVLLCVLFLLAQRLPGVRLVGWLVLVPYAMAVAWSVSDANVLIARFLIYAHVCLLTGIGILSASLPFRALRWGVACVLIAGVAFTAWEQRQFRTRQASRPGMPVAISTLRDTKAEQDLILVCNPMLYLNVCAHQDGLTNVYSYDPGQGFPHFQGTPVMKDEEYFTIADLQRFAGGWVWTLDAENWLGGIWKVHLPAEWKLEQELRIPEWYGTLVIRSYHRDAVPSGSSSQMASER